MVLLRFISVWNESIEKYVPLPVYKFYRFLIQYIFVSVAAGCETIHLKAFESFEVWNAKYSQVSMSYWHTNFTIIFSPFISQTCRNFAIIFQLLQVSAIFPSNYSHFTRRLMKFINFQLTWIRLFFGHVTKSSKSIDCTFVESWFIMFKISCRMMESTEKFVKSINYCWFFSITITSFTAPLVPILQRNRILPLQFW